MERVLTKEEADRRYGISEYPDPWDGITDDDVDYTSSCPSIDDILQWVADHEERKRREVTE